MENKETLEQYTKRMDKRERQREINQSRKNVTSSKNIIQTNSINDNSSINDNNSDTSLDIMIGMVILESISE